jgi:signal transduction histidine kinase
MSLLGHVTHLENQLNETKVSLERAISELKIAEKRVVRCDRLAMLGQMTSGVVHDLNNALSPVLAAAELLRPTDFVAEQRDALTLIRAGANHASHVLQQLQYFYRADMSEAASERLSIAEVVQQAVQLTRFRWRDEALRNGIVIELQTAIPDDCFVSGNRTELVQVFTNLILNASQSMPSGGCIRILASSTQDAVSVVVSDEGTGMSSNERANCFKPFFTTKREGSGLGLSICHDTVHRTFPVAQCLAGEADTGRNGSHAACAVDR